MVKTRSFWVLALIVSASSTWAQAAGAGKADRQRQPNPDKVTLKERIEVILHAKRVVMDRRALEAEIAAKQAEISELGESLDQEIQVAESLRGIAVGALSGLDEATATAAQAIELAKKRTEERDEARAQAETALELAERAALIAEEELKIILELKARVAELEAHADPAPAQQD